MPAGKKSAYRRMPGAPKASLLYTSMRRAGGHISDHLSGQIKAHRELGNKVVDVAMKFGVSIATVSRHTRALLPPSAARDTRWLPQPNTEKREEISARHLFIMHLVNNQWQKWQMALAARERPGEDDDIADQYWKPLTRAEIVKQYYMVYGIRVSLATISNDLHTLKVRCLARKGKPSLTIDHKFLRVEGAKIFLEHPQWWRDLLLFSDEKYFTLQEAVSDGFMYCPEGKPPLPFAKDQHPKGVMVFGIMGSSGLYVQCFPSVAEMRDAEIAEAEAICDAAIKRARDDTPPSLTRNLRLDPLFKKVRDEAREEFAKAKAKIIAKKGIDTARFIKHAIHPFRDRKDVNQNIYRRFGAQLQQDNASIHFTPATVAAWEGMGITLMDCPWPAKSPDGSCIELAWSWLAREVSRSGAQTREQLVVAIDKATALYNARGLAKQTHAGFTQWCHDVIVNEGETTAWPKTRGARRQR
jgi:hypothetical protein